MISASSFIARGTASTWVPPRAMNQDPMIDPNTPKSERILDQPDDGRVLAVRLTHYEPLGRHSRKPRRVGRTRPALLDRAHERRRARGSCTRVPRRLLASQGAACSRIL